MCDVPLLVSYFSLWKANLCSTWPPHTQLSPFKKTFFGTRCFKILMWFPDECVWCFISVRLLARIVPLHRTPPPVLNKLTIHHCFQKEILHVCYWSPSVVRAFSILVSSLFPPRRETDMWFPGQRWMYHSRVLSDLLWTGVHYTELTSRSLWKGMLVMRWLYVYYEMLSSRGGQICFWEGLQLD